MGYTLADAYIVIAAAVAFVAWQVMRTLERRRRLEVIHKERLAAIDKGLPLPELPIDPPRRPRDPREPLMHGLAWTALGFGGLVSLLIMGPVKDGLQIWPLPLPLMFLGLGLLLYYALASRRER